MSWKEVVKGNEEESLFAVTSATLSDGRKIVWEEKRE